MSKKPNTTDEIIRVTKEAQVSVHRRDLVSALLGVAGAGVTASVLAACASETGKSEGDGNLGIAKSALNNTTNIQWVDTLASLRALTGMANAVSILEGYSAIGDGGGGLFVWTTASLTDDGGTVLNSGGTHGGTVSGSWVRIYSGPLNVRWFGAKGDGSANDTVAIAQAINACTLNPVPYTAPRSIYVPPGTYLTEPITGLDDGFILAGASPYGGTLSRSTLKSLSGGNVIDISGKEINELTIRDLQIVGNNPAGGTAWAWQGTTGHGIYEHSTNGSFVKGFVLTNLRIDTCKGNGVLLLAAFQTTLHNVGVNDCLGNAFEVADGNTCTFISCYAGRVPASNDYFQPCGYRVYAGNPVLIGCTGLDGGSDWAVFGRGGTGYIADSLGAGGSITDTPSYCWATLIGCNVESFSRYGLNFKPLSYASMFGVTFIPLTGSPNSVAALRYDFFDASTSGLGVLDSTCKFYPGSGYSLDAVVAHGGLPFLSMNTTITHGYDPGLGIYFSIPTILGGANNSINISNASLQKMYLAGSQHASGTAAPTTGTWAQGDLVWNSAIAVGHPNGWRCTVGGTPGTWVAMANL